MWETILQINPTLMAIPAVCLHGDPAREIGGFANDLLDMMPRMVGRPAWRLAIGHGYDLR